MFERTDVEAMARMTAALGTDPVCSDDTGRVTEIRALEELKCAAEARQAALAAELTESKGTAAQVARHDGSPTTVAGSTSRSPGS